ncbi:NTP transferase domain-containing protein [Chromohalobacter sarecensis]|uniref:NTP transferase domain-containing protein n=1 Tax=Chromohalobacter sarecensis TaxID=245294 RepID=A0ABV9CXV9_9GAMM|nr:nucleotidyltransferase family protein [Chromohalobacter sarecensis]MCK0713396.1 nucleotidyltransferase family protein [Chromohalobacter sarecensis]
MHSERVVAVIMAAGGSRRYGDADKRRASGPWEGTLLGASQAKAREAFACHRVVVRAGDDPACLGLAENTPLIRATRAEHGLGASLAEAFVALASDPALADVQAAAILLGDMPAIRSDTLLHLQRLADTEHILRPCYAGRPGHPVLFGRAFWPALTRLDGDTGARRLIRQHPERYREVEVDDPGILLDIDTPADLQFEIRNTDAQAPY